MSRAALADPEAARAWLSAGLDLCRVGPSGAASLPDAATLLPVATAELADLPPPGVLLDIARLFIDPRQQLSTSVPEQLADVLRPYEDTVLGRLVTDPLRLAVADAIAGLPDALHTQGLVVLAERILERAGFTGGHPVHPGAVRELDRIADEDWQVRSMDPSPDALNLLRASYTDLIHGFQQIGRALHPTDVGVLEQLPVLTDRSDRLALSQVLSAAELLAVELPGRVRPSRRRNGHVSTKLLDDSAYPVGGFSSISTRGSIENLVSSELALMEDDEDVDLFDMRYTEGELLFYTRDENAFVRPRRRFVIDLSPHLVDARFRDATLPYQRMVLALGWTTALIRTLLRWLDRQDLVIRVLLPAQGLEDEVRLLTWALADGLHAGWVVLGTTDELHTRLQTDARVAPVDRIALQQHDRPLTTEPNTWTTRLVVGEQPTVYGPFSPVTPPDHDPLTTWRRTLLDALMDLI